MHCGNCHSHMDETHRESTPQSTQVWYKCTMCGRISMHSLLTHRHIAPEWWEWDDQLADEHTERAVQAKPGAL